MVMTLCEIYVFKPVFALPRLNTIFASIFFSVFSFCLFVSLKRDTLIKRTLESMYMYRIDAAPCQKGKMQAFEKYANVLW